METFRYYRQSMDKTERQIYDALAAGMASLAPSVHVPRLPYGALSDILYRVRLDDPLLCCFRDASFCAARGAEHADVLFRYTLEPSKARAMDQALGVRVRKLCAPAAALDDAGKVKYVHDLLLDSVRYDKLSKNYAHEVIGPVCHGVGVCEGIAKTVKLLLDALGVESMVVIGEGDAERHGIDGMRHAWNIVWVNGQTYHMDVTFDLSLTRCGVRRYDYFCLSEAEIFLDHRAPVYAVPGCVSAYRYYQRQRLTADSLEALQKLLGRLGKKRGSVFLFQWSAPEELPMEEIARVCTGFAAAHGRRARLSCNRTQRVVLLTLAGGADETEGEIYERLPD
ncbi:MAG: transglutaminase domain-containing protein [Eubacteriales bacterium]